MTGLRKLYWCSGGKGAKVDPTNTTHTNAEESIWRINEITLVTISYWFQFRDQEKQVSGFSGFCSTVNSSTSGEILIIHLFKNWTRWKHGVYFFMLWPLGKDTKDHKVQFQISKNPQFSALLDPRVRRDIGRVPKNKAIKPDFNFASNYTIFRCASISWLHVGEWLSGWCFWDFVKSWAYLQSVFRVCSECVQSVSRVPSECLQSAFRVPSECLQSAFRVPSECL